MDAAKNCHEPTNKAIPGVGCCKIVHIRYATSLYIYSNGFPSLPDESSVMIVRLMVVTMTRIKMKKGRADLVNTDESWVIPT